MIIDCLIYTIRPYRIVCMYICLGADIWGFGASFSNFQVPSINQFYHASSVEYIVQSRQCVGCKKIYKNIKKWANLIGGWQQMLLTNQPDRQLPNSRTMFMYVNTILSDMSTDSIRIAFLIIVMKLPRPFGIWISMAPIKNAINVHQQFSMKKKKNYLDFFFMYFLVIRMFEISRFQLVLSLRGPTIPVMKPKVIIVCRQQGHKKQFIRKT